MSDDLLDTRRRLKQRSADIDDRVDRADNPPPPKKKKGSKTTPTRRGTTLDQAKRTEHKGSKGERAFGAPMDTGAAERQTTDSNN